MGYFLILIVKLNYLYRSMFITVCHSELFFSNERIENINLYEIKIHLRQKWNSDWDKLIMLNSLEQLVKRFWSRRKGYNRLLNNNRHGKKRDNILLLVKNGSGDRELIFFKRVKPYTRKRCARMLTENGHFRFFFQYYFTLIG